MKFGRIITLLFFTLIAVTTTNAQCKNLKELYAKLSPTIVFIKADYELISQGPNIFGLPDPLVSSKFFTGTAVLIRSDGLILSTDHLVDSIYTESRIIAFGITINTRYKLVSLKVFHYKQSYDAQVLGIDKFKRTALIQLVPTGQKFNFPSAKIGDGEKLKPGECVFSIANGGNIENDMKYGIASSIQDILGSGVNYIMSHKGIGEGDSGGPVFNQRGEIVGINTYIHNRQPNTSMAILLDNYLKKSIHSLLHGEPIEQTAFYGEIREMRSFEKELSMAQQKEMRLQYALPEDLKEGIFIMKSDQPEFLIGDVILEIDHNKVPDGHTFFRILDEVLPRQKLCFTILRKQKVIETCTAIGVYKIN